MSRETCSFCGRVALWPCLSTREMRDTENDLCFAALMMHGGGEYTEDRLLSAELMRRAGLVRKEPRDADLSHVLPALKAAKAFLDRDQGCNGFTAEYELLRLDIDLALAKAEPRDG